MREELTALRSAMKRAGIDAYVIPTDDFHGSEYVGEYFKCRAYVSGFTGSAGTLVVTADWAGLWTDGRYFLQAARQLEGSGIDLCRMGEPGVPTVQGWLETHMEPGTVLGFDGRTMTLGTGRRLEEAMTRRRVSVRYDRDLVGEIWTDRPGLSQAPAWSLPLSYTGCSRGQKLQDLRAAMQQNGADCHILSSLDDIAWLMNLRGDDVACCPVFLSFLLVFPDRAVLYADEGKFAPVLRKYMDADGIELRPYLDLFGDVKALPAGTRVLADPDKISYAIVKNLPATAVLLEEPNPTQRPKAVKNPVEQENMKNAHIRDGVALTRFMKWLKENVGREPMTEISVAEKLEEFRREQDFYAGPSFDPIFGYGPNGAIIHYSATPETDAAIRPEGLLLSDTGGHYLDGTTDVTRTFALGPVTEEMKHHYTLVLRSHLALLNAKFKRGCSGTSLDILARQPLWEEGLDYNHGTGHGVGFLLCVHEGPQNINYRTTRIPAELEPGMITSDEPGLYLEGKYGIRLESLVLCVERETGEYGTFLGFDALTMCPFDLDAVNPGELSDTEKRQLNAYHETVYQTLSPLLPQEELPWLRNATRPI